MNEPPTLTPDAVPQGFRFAAVRAGIKPSGRPDLACAIADAPAAAAAMFTTNRAAAAPVLVGREHLKASGSRIRAVVVNSGNANCATGAAGLEDARAACAGAAKQLGCAAAEVLPCSTGIIGVPLAVDKLLAALPAALDSAAPEGFSGFAQAILTTDTRAKIAFRQVGGVRLLGAAKGAGMIHPRLAPPHATMLVFLFTDAEVADPQGALARAVEPSFNRISIDGDTSTNDTVLLLASGAAGPAPPGFGAALDELCRELALAIVEDGEGVTHVITLEIEGAGSDADALAAAKAVAHSPLVKTAWAGADPNWGRLLSTLGASGVPLNLEDVAVTLNGLPVCERGMRAPSFRPDEVHAAMLERRFTLGIRLGAGPGKCRFWTTDLTQEYVRINADYST